jgi:hypothetical protein
MDKSNTVVKHLTGKVIQLIAVEINKKETQLLVRQKVIIPVINLIYSEIYPYVFGLITVISMILFVSLSTLICFIFVYVRKS